MLGNRMNLLSKVLMIIKFVWFLHWNWAFIRYFRALRFYRGSYKWFFRCLYPEDYILSGFSWDVENYMVTTQDLRDCDEFWRKLNYRWIHETLKLY